MTMSFVEVSTVLLSGATKVGCGGEDRILTLVSESCILSRDLGWTYTGPVGKFQT